MKRKLKDFAKRLAYRLFRLLERFGVHVLPVHYYSPVPDLGALERTREVWAKKSALPGIHSDLDEQVAALRSVCAPYISEYASGDVYREAMRRNLGPGYGPIEAQALHAVIRHFKPKRIIEVGSGTSTWCMLAAVKRNEAEGARTSITCIEPYPSAGLRATPDITLIASPVQRIATEMFEELGENDFLFIDSSHAVKPGSDVNYLILEILPRLKPGVIVHVHDIALPYDYQRDLFHNLFAWTETSLLRAFLIHNPHARILFCLSQLHYDRKTELTELFPSYRAEADADGLRSAALKPFQPSDGHFPSSLYFRIL